MVNLCISVLGWSILEEEEDCNSGGRFCAGFDFLEYVYFFNLFFGFGMKKKIDVNCGRFGV